MSGIVGRVEDGLTAKKVVFVAAGALSVLSLAACGSGGAGGAASNLSSAASAAKQSTAQACAKIQTALDSKGENAAELKTELSPSRPTRRRLWLLLSPLLWLLQASASASASEVRESASADASAVRPRSPACSCRCARRPV